MIRDPGRTEGRGIWEIDLTWLGAWYITPNKGNEDSVLSGGEVGASLPRGPCSQPSPEFRGLGLDRL